MVGTPQTRDRRGVAVSSPVPTGHEHLQHTPGIGLPFSLAFDFHGSTHVFSLAGVLPSPPQIQPPRAKVKQQTYSDILQDRKNRTCPVVVNDTSEDHKLCKQLKAFDHPSGVLRHFISVHRDIAKATLPHACLTCVVDCKSADALAEHEKAPKHLAEVAKANNAAKKRSAAQAVQLYIVVCN
jgi:hypothetical protein